jgi:hypothetical protein
MTNQMNLCEFIKNIEKDPLKKIEDLTIGEFYQLKDHIHICFECSEAVNRILEAHKDVPDNLDSDWSKTRFN